MGLQTDINTLEINVIFLRKLERVLPEDLVIPFLVIYPKYATPYHKDKYFTVSKMVTPQISPPYWAQFASMWFISVLKTRYQETKDEVSSCPYSLPFFLLVRS